MIDAAPHVIQLKAIASQPRHENLAQMPRHTDIATPLINASFVQLALNQVHWPMACKDSSHRYVFVNDRYAVLVGVECCLDMVGRRARDYFPELVARIHERRDLQAQCVGVVNDEDCWIRDGVRYHFLATRWVLRHPDYAFTATLLRPAVLQAPGRSRLEMQNEPG